MRTIPSPSSPIPSLVLGAAGGAMVGARQRRTTVGAVTAIAGLALVGVAAHRPLADALRRAAARRRSVALRLSFSVRQPVSEVFHFCTDFSNFPRFIGALREVTDYGDGRSHWVASTPTGAPIEWNAETTKFVTNRVIAWRSTPGSPVSATGMLRFVSQSDGGTCIKVALDYCVNRMSVTDAVAALATRASAKWIEADVRRLAEHLDLLDASARAPLASG
jgi:uncharacterized membrane protein